MAEFLHDLNIHGAGQIQFKTTAGANAGKIDQNGNDLVLSNPVGDIIIGNGSDDVFIGDGTNAVDIRFEQNMAIFADSSSTKTLTLGGSNTSLILESPTFNGTVTLGATTINNKLTFTTGTGYIVFDYEPSTGSNAEYSSEVPLLKIDHAGTEKTILSRLTNNAALAIGNDDTVAIVAGDTKAVIKDNINYVSENVIFASEGGFYAYGFPGNDVTWSNRNVFQFRSESSTASDNGLYIGDGGQTQFIDLSRNLKNIGTISSGAITATDYRSSSHIYLTSGDSWIFRSTGGTEYARFKSNGYLGIGTTNPDEKLHVMYAHADGTATTYAKAVIEDTDAQLDLLSTSSGTWGSSINLVEAAGSGANTDVWGIARKTTGGSGDSSLNFNFGTSNQHDNTTRVSFSSTGNITAAGHIYLTSNSKLFLTNDGTSNFIQESSDNVIDFVSAGVVGLQLSGTSATMRSVNFNGNITTHTDSTFNIGTSSKRFANIYADTLHGDGSNITGVTATDNTKLPLTGGTLTGNLTISTGSDNILTLNQTSTDNKWNYINFNNQGTREWFIGQDSDGNFDLYNDNINAYAITVNLSNNSILLNDTVTVAQALTVTSGDVTLSAGNIIVGSQYGIRFNDANTRIYTNTDTPEDLLVEADQDILLTPDGQVNVHSNLVLSDNSYVISARKFTARDGNGVMLTADDASSGLSIADNGNATFTGSVTATSLDINGDGDFSGNLNITGNITNANWQGDVIGVAKGGTGVTANTTWLNANSFANFASSSADWDTITTRGSYRLTGSTNNPFGSAHSTGIVITQGSGDYGIQLFSSASTDNGTGIAYRYRGTSWQNWQYLVTKTYGDGRYGKIASPTFTGTVTAAALTVTGDLTVNGTTTTVNQTNLDVSDNIIGLNRGSSSNANDSGIIIERGSTGDNAAILWDESNDDFVFGLTTATPSATGNVSLSDYRGIKTGPITASGSITVSGTVDGVDIAARDAVLTSTTTTANAALPKAGGTMTGSLTIGSNTSGHDFLVYGNATGEKMFWDASESHLTINHDDGDHGLEIYPVSSTSPTAPQIRIGRDNGQYWGAYVTDSVAHLVHRQDETGGSDHFTKFQIWTNATGSHAWQWDMATNAGASVSTKMKLTDSGVLTLGGGSNTITNSKVATWDSAYTATNAFTTVGTAFTQLGDVSVASYIRINADETLSYLNAAQFLSAIGGVDGSAYLPLAGGTMTGDITLSTDADILKAGTNPFRVFTNGTLGLSISASQHATFAGSITGQDSGIIIDSISGPYGRIHGTSSIFLGGSSTSNVQLSAQLIPDADSTRSLGNSSRYWSNAYIDQITTTGNIIVGGTVDGVDIATRDGVLTSTTTTANAALPKAGGTMTGHLRINDSLNLYLGNQTDLVLSHNGTNSFISNYVGDLIIENAAADKDLYLKGYNGSGGVANYLILDGSQVSIRMKRKTKWDDNIKATFGDGEDLEIYHDGTTSNISNNTGNLSIINHTNDGDIKFFSDDSSGGVTEYFRVDGGENRTVFSIAARWVDNAKIMVGSGADLQLWHDASNSYISNEGNGHLYIQNTADDKDIIFKTDNGSGGTSAYITLDGSATSIEMYKSTRFHDAARFTANATFDDGSRAKFGDDDDLQIYHGQNHSYIDASSGAGSLYIRPGAGNTVQIEDKDGNDMINASPTEVRLFYNGSEKLATTSSGIIINNSNSITTDSGRLQVNGAFKATGDIVDVDIPYVIHTGWGDDTSTTANKIIPLGNSVTEQNVSAADGQHFFVAPYAGSVKKIIMKNVAGTLSSGFTTELKLYINGSQAVASGELTASSSAITWEPSSSNTFSAADTISLVYQKSASSKYWREVALTMVLIMDSQDI